MKKIALIISTLLIVTSSLFANNTITRNYNFGKITSIEAGSIFSIGVTQGNANGVRIECDDIYEDILDIKYHQGELKLALVPKSKVNRNNHDKNQIGIKVYLQMPTIAELDLSGASSLKAMGEFSTDELDVELSGASSITGLVINGNNLSLDCSGASSLNMKGDFNTIETEISGAATVTLKSNSSSFEGEFSGAATVKIYGNHKNTDVTCSGASNLTLEGKTDFLKSVTTGASNLKAQEYTALNGYAQVSGASNAKVRCTGDLKVLVSSSSKLTYFGNPNVINLKTDNNIRKGDD